MTQASLGVEAKFEWRSRASLRTQSTADPERELNRTATTRKISRLRSARRLCGIKEVDARFC
jgi:hypothetical protein